MFVISEIILIALLSGLAVFLPLSGRRWSRGGAVIVGLVVLCVFAARFGARIPATPHVPRLVTDDEFVSSRSCQKCHPAEYASWHASYHRTMTQWATPETVLGPFDNVELRADRRSYLLEQRGHEFWVTMPDLEWESEAQRRGYNLQMLQPPVVQRQVVMTTGSHHRQICWVAPPPEQAGYPLRQLPWYYMVAESRWVPREEVFLRPPGRPPSFPVWNTGCIQCHSVGGKPNYDFRTLALDTELAELGIACEACHGPAEQHVRQFGNPLERYRAHLRGEPGSDIVNPARCSSKISSQICGQCHSLFVTPADYLSEGFHYRPGSDLEESGRIVLRYEDLVVASEDSNISPELRSYFWEDGTCRVGGNEYNGMIDSPCFLRGQLSCQSCHSMHRSNPNDQLAEGMDGNQACLQCHESYGEQLEQHTHHQATSSGSLCYNCHMPFTSYALFTAQRSHRIDNPSVANSVRTGRPNACNLCHLDKTQAWAAGYLSDWYGARSVELESDDRTIAASLLWLLRGDAVQRAITAWAMGWDAAHESSGTDWQAPFLIQTLDDPYSIVRYLAHRSLRRLPMFEDSAFDFIGAPQQRAESIKRAEAMWRQRAARRATGHGTEVLLQADGTSMQEIVERLLRERDDTAVSMPE